MTTILQRRRWMRHTAAAALGLAVAAGVGPLAWAQPGDPVEALHEFVREARTGRHARPRPRLVAVSGQPGGQPSGRPPSRCTWR